MDNMVEVEYKEYLIKIFEDTTYTLNSMDNKYCYNNVYPGNIEYQTKNVGINIYDLSDNIVNNAIILNFGFSSFDSFIIENDKLFILVGNALYSLELIDLKLLWSIECDPSTCFEIIKLENDFLIHGEQVISRIDSNGNKKWEFYGADIFASADDSNYVKINETNIEITDFSHNYYMIDFNGNLIKDKLA